MSPDPLHIRLSTIPLSAWEDELPSLDLIIRETLRISGSVTAFRRNIEKDIQIGEATIKQGDFVAYSMADVNLNPDIYTNPMIFDPDRYGPGREEDRKEIYGYLSWGAGMYPATTSLASLMCYVLGRHPCAGMKMAKLEIKSVLAMILLGYEYELVDDNGNYPKALPDQDRNDLLQVSLSPYAFYDYELGNFFCLVATYGGLVLSEIQTHRRVKQISNILRWLFDIYKQFS